MDRVACKKAGGGQPSVAAMAVAVAATAAAAAAHAVHAAMLDLVHQGSPADCREPGSRAHAAIRHDIEPGALRHASARLLHSWPLLQLRCAVQYKRSGQCVLDMHELGIACMELSATADAMHAAEIGCRFGQVLQQYMVFQAHRAYGGCQCQ
jgi:hypothetical protein